MMGPLLDRDFSTRSPWAALTFHCQTGILRLFARLRGGTERDDLGTEKNGGYPLVN